MLNNGFMYKVKRNLKQLLSYDLTDQTVSKSNFSTKINIFNRLSILSHTSYHMAKNNESFDYILKALVKDCCVFTSIYTYNIYIYFLTDNESIIEADCIIVNIASAAASLYCIKFTIFNHI